MRRRMRLRVLLAGAVLPLALWAALPVFSQGAASPSGRLNDIQRKIKVTQGKIGKRKGTERLLTTQISAYSQRIGRLQGRIGTLQSQQANAQADLDAKRNELFKTQRDLRAERRRLVRLRARLAQARTALAQRLVELYQADKPDIVTVIMSSKGFAELLERGEFMQRVSEQDQSIIKIVRTPRPTRRPPLSAWTSSSAASRSSPRSSSSAATRSPAPSRASSTRRSALAGTRADKAHALGTVRAERQQLEGNLSGLKAEQSKIQATLQQSQGTPPGGADQAGQRQPHLAGQRAHHLAVLRAPGLGGLPPGHRHRRPHGHADPRGRRGHGGPHAVGRSIGRLRQLHLHPAHRSDVDVLRAPVALRHLAGRAASARARSSATPAAPGCASARTCTSRCASTARSPTRSTTSETSVHRALGPWGRGRPGSPSAQRRTARMPGTTPSARPSPAARPSPLGRAARARARRRAGLARRLGACGSRADPERRRAEVCPRPPAARSRRPPRRRARPARARRAPWGPWLRRSRAPSTPPAPPSRAPSNRPIRRPLLR